MPYKSEAQRAFFHANRQALEAKGVHIEEWDEASKGLKLPERVTMEKGIPKSAPKKVKEEDERKDKKDHVKEGSKRDLKEDKELMENHEHIHQHVHYEHHNHMHHHEGGDAKKAAKRHEEY